PDFYSITVFDTGGAAVFHAEGALDCGNLQLHPSRGLSGGGKRGSSDVTLTEVHPNPFAHETRIAYAVTNANGSQVALGVYNVAGRLVRKLVNGYQVPGSHEIAWDGRDDRGTPAMRGVYFVRCAGAPGGEAMGTRVLYLR